MRQALVISVLGLLVVFVGVELGLRGLLAVGYLVDVSDGHFAESPYCPFTLKKSYSGKLVRQTIEHRVNTNSLGLRGPELDARPKILMIGDSMTFGFGVEDDHTIAAQLGRELGSHQVVNAGFHCGNSPDSYGIGLDRLIPEVRPEAIIVNLFQNDLDDVSKNHWTRDVQGGITRIESSVFAPVNGNLINSRYQRFPLLRLVATKVYLVRVLRRNLVTKREPHEPEDIRKIIDFYSVREYRASDVERFKESLSLLHDVVVSKWKLPLYVFLIGGRTRDSLSDMEKIVTAFYLGKPGVQVFNFHEQLRFRELYIPGDGHYNARGTQRVAQLLAAHLRRNLPAVRPEPKAVTASLD